ncbi:alkaline phosphatase D family protein [Pelagicoccus sp. SDUM812005]|nr:alkaline phosphatase D family protein [Pelagicoccus sp. SDUM812005]
MNTIRLGLLVLASMAVSHLLSATVPYFGNGIKVGEVTQDSVVFWVRLTEVEKGNPQQAVAPAPGVVGWYELSYRERGKNTDWMNTERRPVSAERDFTDQLRLEGLRAGAQYEFEARAYQEGSTKRPSEALKGHFRTAKPLESIEGVKGVVVTCQGLGTVDDPVMGHKAYADILQHDADFFVHTGDIVYYDKDYDGVHPLSKNRAQARERWNRMFSMHWNRDFHSQISSYFLKDDHDVLKDDCYPGQTYGDLTFEEGLEIFREQTTQSPLPYRTVRWSKDVQIWLLEGRDYRTPNRAPDGPEKSMLGQEQKAWLKRTISESDATFKLVISPSPIVGPDKPGKKDNLSNDVYRTEGDEIRRFLSGVEDLYVICGDRHWQYASKDAETGLVEIGCGPINNEHAKLGGNPGRQKEHLYFGGGEGGYLVFEVKRADGRPFISFRWYSISGSDGSVGTVNCEMSFPAMRP